MHREILRLPPTVPLKFKQQSKFYIITGRRKLAELCHITELVTYCRRLGLNDLHENDTKKKKEKIQERHERDRSNTKVLR